MMWYKGYAGMAEYDDEAGIFHGEVINTRDVITFDASVTQRRLSANQSMIISGGAGKTARSPISRLPGRDARISPERGQLRRYEAGQESCLRDGSGPGIYSAASGIERPGF